MMISPFPLNPFPPGTEPNPPEWWDREDDFDFDDEDDE